MARIPRACTRRGRVGEEDQGGGGRPCRRAGSIRVGWALKFCDLRAQGSWFLLLPRAMSGACAMSATVGPLLTKPSQQAGAGREMGTGAPAPSMSHRVPPRVRFQVQLSLGGGGPLAPSLPQQHGPYILVTDYGAGAHVSFVDPVPPAPGGGGGGAGGAGGWGGGGDWGGGAGESNFEMPNSVFGPLAEVVTEEGAGCLVLFDVTGMSCGKCAAKVKAALEGGEGVKAASAGAKQNRAIAILAYEPTFFDQRINKLAELITSKGFKAKLFKIVKLKGLPGAREKLIAEIGEGSPFTELTLPPGASSP